MSKIMIVGLLQAVLAQNIPNARPYSRTNIYPGRHFFYRDPQNRNLEVSSQDMRKTEYFNTHKPYTDQNEKDRHDQEPLMDERTAVNNKEYALTEDPESGYNGGVNNGRVNSFGRKNHRVAVHRNNGQYRTSDGQDTAHSELDSWSHTRGVDSDLIRSHYNTKKNRHKAIRHARIRTKKNVNPRAANEWTTEPAKRSNDNPREIRHNSVTPLFVKIDNREQDTLDSKKTDYDVRFNKNGIDSNIEDNKWVWDPTTPTGFVLDDRNALTGGCLENEAFVLDVCVPRH